MSTPRLNLRRLETADAASVSGLMTRTVSQWLTNFPVPFALAQAQAQERIARIRHAEREGKAFISAIERRCDASFLGWFGVYRDPISTCGVLGYWLGEPFQGFGYMREAAPAALQIAIAELRLTEVEAYVHPENLPSIAILLGLGLKADGDKLVHASARGRDELCLRLVKRLPT